MTDSPQLRPVQVSASRHNNNNNNSAPDLSAHITASGRDAWTPGRPAVVSLRAAPLLAGGGR